MTEPPWVTGVFSRIVTAVRVRCTIRASAAARGDERLGTIVETSARRAYPSRHEEKRMRVGRAMQIAGVAAVLSVLAGGNARAGEATFESKLGSDAAKIADDVKISMMNGDNAGREDGRGLVPYYKARRMAWTPKPVSA
jgi:hypothetical protein